MLTDPAVICDEQHAGTLEVFAVVKHHRRSVRDRVSWGAGQEHS